MLGAAKQLLTRARAGLGPRSVWPGNIHWRQTGSQRVVESSCASETQAKLKYVTMSTVYNRAARSIGPRNSYAVNLNPRANHRSHTEPRVVRMGYFPMPFTCGVPSRSERTTIQKSIYYCPAGTAYGGREVAHNDGSFAQAGLANVKKLPYCNKSWLSAREMTRKSSIITYAYPCRPGRCGRGYNT